MKTAARWLLAVLVLAWWVPLLVAAPDLSAPLPAVHLKDGRDLTNLKIVVFGPKVVMARWDGGRGSLHVDLFPDEIAQAIREKAGPEEEPAPESSPVPAPPLSQDTGQARRPPPAPLAPQGVLSRQNLEAAEALMDRSVAAEGGADLLAMKAIRLTGKAGPPGDMESFVLTASSDHSVRAEDLINGGKIIHCEGPSGPWEAVQAAGQGLIRAELPEHLKGPLSTIFEGGEIYEPLWHWREIGAKVTAIRLVRLKGEDGGPLPGVDISLELSPGRVLMYEFIDNGVPMPFVRKALVLNGSLMYEKERSNFQQIGRILYPMRTVSRQEQGVLMVDCSQVEIDPVLDPKTFTGP